MLNLCDPKIHMLKSLPSKVMVLVVLNHLWEVIQHEEGALTSGVSAFMKEAAGRALVRLHARTHTVRCLHPRRGSSAKLPGALVSDFQPLEP